MIRSKAFLIVCAIAPLFGGCDESPPVEPAPRTGCAATRVIAPVYPYDSAVLESRRAALFAQIDTGIAVVSGVRVPNNHLEDGTTRVAPDFYYLTGLDAHEGLLVLIARESGPDEALLFVEGVQSGGVPAHEITGIDDVRCLEDGIPALDSLVRGGPAIPQRLRATIARVHDEALLAFLDTLPFTHLNVARRGVKDAEEIERLRESAAISRDGLLEGMADVGPGAFEGDVKGVIEGVFAERDALLAFGSIVASGTNALELHYRAADDTMHAGGLVIIDVGAEHARYAGDVARTLPVGGTFTPRQRELYDIVVEARQAVLDAFAAGLGPAAAEEAYYEVYTERWETCGEWCYNLMPHALFHSVGLDVHDSGFVEYGENVAGTVLNVEPGLYLPEEGFGMRLEDTVLLTGNGYELLTDGLPTTADEVEAFMAAHSND